MIEQETEKVFVVVVTSREVRTGYGGSVMTPKGAKFIATEDSEGWVEATSSHSHGEVPNDAKTFTTLVDAEEFAERWEGHPWWCRPSGKYEILEVTPRYKQVREGYEVCVTASSNQEKP